MEGLGDLSDYYGGAARAAKTMADWEKELRDKEEYEYQKETRRGLGKIFSQQPQAEGVSSINTSPNPARSAFDLQKAGGEILSDSLPSRAEGMDSQSRAEVMDKGAILPPQVPQGLGSIVEQPPATIQTPGPTIRPNPQDLQYERAAGYLASRGDLKGMKELEGAIDITSKINQRDMNIMSAVTKAISDRKKAGFSIEANRKITMAEINAMNQKAGRIMMDPREVEGIDFNDAGHVVKDIGGGQVLVLVTQDNGVVKPFIVDRNKEQRVENETERLKQGQKRIDLAWARLNPRLMADLEAAKSAGKELSKDTINGMNDYYNAKDANRLLDEAEAIYNKDPNNLVGWSARFRSKLSEIDPAFEAALNSGDRQYFSRLMMNNADTFKKLLGPQISNADADLMFKLSGATARTPQEIAATFRTLRKRNNDTIRQWETKAGVLAETAPVAGELAGVTPAPKPYTGMSPAAGKSRLPPPANTPTIIKNPKTGKKLYLNKAGTAWVEKPERPEHRGM